MKELPEDVMILRLLDGLLGVTRRYQHAGILLLEESVLGGMRDLERYQS